MITTAERHRQSIIALGKLGSLAVKLNVLGAGLELYDLCKVADRIYDEVKKGRAILKAMEEKRCATLTSRRH